MTIEKNFIPLFLLIVVVLGYQVFQTVEVVSEINTLHQLRVQQDTPLSNINKLQHQVDVLALGTLRLSENGNASAIDVINKFKKAGITIKGSEPKSPANSGN